MTVLLSVIRMVKYTGDEFGHNPFPLKKGMMI